MVSIGARNVDGCRETAIGNLVVKAMATFFKARYNYAAGEYLAFCNTGSLRAGLKAGAINYDMIRAILPFGGICMHHTSVMCVWAGTMRVIWFG